MGTLTVIISLTDGGVCSREYKDDPKYNETMKNHQSFKYIIGASGELTIFKSGCVLDVYAAGVWRQVEFDYS